MTGWQAAVPGRTVLLTTHYMAEADELCERIAIVDRGRVLAIGTPGRAQAARPARVDLPARARPARRRPGRARPRARRRQRDRRDGRRRRGRRRRSRQTVEVNLVLVDDAALGGVVGALGGLGSRILALRKSEPTLEDVFVELVGRGFDDEDGRTGRPRRAERAGAAGGRPTSPASPTRRRSHDAPGRSSGDRRPDRARRPTGAARRIARQQPAERRRPGLPARPRAGPRAVVAALRDPPAVPDHVARSCSSTARSRRRRSTSGSSSSAGR